MTMAGIEVTAVRAAISTTLNVVVNKLAPPVIEWYSSVDGVAEDLQELLDLVKEIKRWLDTSGYEAMVSDTSFNWLKRLKEVAYDVDDIVDEFQLKAEKHSLRSAGWSWNGVREKYCWAGWSWSWWLEWCERKLLLGWSWSWLPNAVIVLLLVLALCPNIS